MGPRVAIVGGLLAGLVAGGLLLVALVAFLPVTGGAPSSAPSVSVEPSATPAASGTPVASLTPGPSPSPTPSLAPPTPAATVGSAAFHVGEEAPPLRVEQVDGGTLDLAELRGRPVWIVFMATWCPSCLDEFPLMNRFAARYADEGLVVAAIDVGEDRETVAAYAEQLNVIFPMGLDRDGAVADAWGVVVPPIHFFIDAGGIVRDGALGGIGPDLMAASLRTIMPGVDVTP